MFNPLVSDVRFSDAIQEILFGFGHEKQIEIQLENKSSYDQLKLVFDSLNPGKFDHIELFGSIYLI